MTSPIAYLKTTDFQHLSGVPADLHDELNPDWLPTQNWATQKLILEQYQRAVDRCACVENQKKLIEAAQALILLYQDLLVAKDNKY